MNAPLRGAAPTKLIGLFRTSHMNVALVLVTADHVQSVHIIGVVDTTVAGAIQNVRSNQAFTGLTGGASGFPDYDDANGDGYPENTNRYRLAVGYRTGDHTGSSVPLTAEGPGARLFTGYYDQTEIFIKMAAVLTKHDPGARRGRARQDRLPRRRAQLLSQSRLLVDIRTAVCLALLGTAVVPVQG